jgi:hypothetical protein
MHAHVCTQSMAALARVRIPDPHRPVMAWGGGCKCWCTSSGMSAAIMTGGGRWRGRSGRPRPSRWRSSVCTALGLHVGDVAAVYVRGWSDGDPVTIAAALSVIH